MIFAASPFVLALVGQTMLSAVDTVFIGRLDPASAVAGQAAMGPSLIVLWCLAALVVTPAALGFRIGQPADSDDATTTRFINNLVVTLALAITVIASTPLFLSPLIEFICAQDTLRELAIPYTQIRLLAIPALAALIAYRGLFEAARSPVPIIIAVVAMNGVNIGLNALLVFGAGPIPAMGITGAALASTVAMVAALAVVMVASVRGEVRRRFTPFRLRHLQLGICMRILGARVVPTLTWLTCLASLLLTFWVVDLTDQAALAAAVDTARHHQFAVVELPEWLFVAPDWPARVVVDEWSRSMAMGRPPLFMTSATLVLICLAILTAGAVAVGDLAARRIAGAVKDGNYQRADAYCWEAVKVTITAVAAIAIPMVFFPQFFLHLFTPQADIIATAAPALRLMASQLLLIAMAAVLVCAHFGVGSWRFALVIVAIHALLLPPLAYLLALVFSLGFMGIWWATGLVLSALALILAVNFWLGTWKPLDE